jgi:hypothetical protein
MPYADPERRKIAKREWNSRHLAAGSTHVSMRSKYRPFLDGLDVGDIRLLTILANQNSASVLAWRINRGFYGPGFKALTHGPEVWVHRIG